MLIVFTVIITWLAVFLVVRPHLHPAPAESFKNGGDRVWLHSELQQRQRLLDELDRDRLEARISEEDYVSARNDLFTEIRSLNEQISGESDA